MMRTHYLQAMGIVDWRLRRCLPFLDYYRLVDAQGQYCSGLIAEISIQQSQPERELLAAIFRALHVQAQPARFDLERPVIALGRNAAHSLPSHHSSIITTYSLAEMLRNPALKAQVWKDLQKTQCFPL